MINVTFYFRKDHAASDAARQMLQELNQRLEFQLTLIDIDSDAGLAQTFGAVAPVVQVGPYRLKYPFTMQELEVSIRAANERRGHLEKIGDKTYLQRVEKGRILSRMDNAVYWLTKHFMAFINILLAIYIGLPFLAPVLMKVGATAPAKVIYTVYGAVCHQLAYRSYFIFGEQTIYPLEQAGIEHTHTFESLYTPEGEASPFVDNNQIILTGRELVGDERIGYKVALCERDIAMYAALLIFGLIYAASGRKIKSVPWYVWLVLGVIPIGLDGGTQFVGLINGLSAWLPLRESTPFLRTLTGGLFGWMTAWFLFPLIHESMAETRALLSSKKAIVFQAKESK